MSDLFYITKVEGYGASTLYFECLFTVINKGVAVYLDVWCIPIVLS